MKKNRKLSYNERYIFSYAYGERLGSIKAMRGMLIRVVSRRSIKQDYTLNDDIKRKINREVNVVWMEESVFALVEDRLSVKDFVLNYDRLFLLPSVDGKTDDSREFDEFPLDYNRDECM